MECHVEMFGLRFEAVILVDAAHMIVAAIRSGRKVFVVTPNVDHIVQFQTDLVAYKIFQQSDFIFADGMPLVWLSRIIPKGSLPGRVTGNDLLPELCKEASKIGLRVAFIGGKSGTPERAGENMMKRFPGLIVAGSYCPPWGFEIDSKETDHIINLINIWKPDILFLGVGTPKQEKWAYDNKDRLSTKAILCVGAALGYAAGMIPRAPLLFQRLGFEWLWRMFLEPKRLWKRYLLRDPQFFLLAIKEVFHIWISFINSLKDKHV